MRAALRQRLLLAAQTDAQAQPAGGGWHSRCLHCRRRLDVRGDGEPLGHCSLEHVVPQAWFGRRAAAALCAQVGDDANDARNLALACAGCNHAKGRHHDARGPQDARAREVVAALLSARLARWRPPPAPTP
ncbi:HNH endonuclease [Xanthomonas sp. LMG 8992]|uniref:HNH endonuclease n=1 Tax=Xanthomonas sp. LMG 8992 TaxID=1591157 RepID=UPI00136E01BA|nr:HNH endonuclease [Xanthomonas sp. LMG 8992]MXV11073.1 HNH endonuclease [Xanthomonas sp. LMG 8992]